MPAGALRDLVGITRALYRAGMAEEQRDTPRLTALEEIGRTLQAALRASRAHPGTILHGEARAAAERATMALQQFVGDAMLLGPVVAVTARRILRFRSMVSSTPARLRDGQEGRE